MRFTGALVIIWTWFASFMFIIFQALFSQDAHNNQLIRLVDAATTGLSNGFCAATCPPAFGGRTCMWQTISNAGHSAHTLGLVAASLITAVTFSVLAVCSHNDTTSAILVDGITPQPVWRLLLARNCHCIAVTYLMLAWVVTAVWLLLGPPNPLGLVGGPILAGIVELVICALALLIIDRWFGRGLTPAKATDKGQRLSSM